jgi:predicted metal-dependent hydrolase
MKSKAPPPATVAAFKSLVTLWAERIRVRPRQVRIQRMRRKWASCSTRGTVSFSTEVLAQPAAFREYVIVHELLHLQVPNHGKLFKTLLRAYSPDYEKILPQKQSVSEAGLAVM